MFGLGLGIFWGWAFTRRCEQGSTSSTCRRYRSPCSSCSP
jgi:hypothetical protein